eukprot:s357_g14.t2
MQDPIQAHQELSQGADRHKICLQREESANSKQLQRLGSGVCIIEVEVEDVEGEGIESKVGTGFLGIFPDHLAGLLFLVTCRHVLPDEASCDNAICTFEASGQPGHSLTQAWHRGPPRSLSEDIMGAGASTEAAEAFNKASIADITAALAALSTEELAKIKEASAGAASASEQKEAGAAEAAKSEEPAQVQDATKPAESATEDGAKPEAAPEEGSKPVEPAAAEEGSKPVEPAAAEAPTKEALEDAELKLKFQAAFRAIDTNKSGFIEVNELEAVLQTLGVNLTSEQVAQVFRAADRNRDDRLDIGEYEALVRKAMPSMQHVAKQFRPCFNATEMDLLETPLPGEARPLANFGWGRRYCRGSAFCTFACRALAVSGEILRFEVRSDNLPATGASGSPLTNRRGQAVAVHMGLWREDSGVEGRATLLRALGIPSSLRQPAPLPRRVCMTGRRGTNDVLNGIYEPADISETREHVLQRNW